MATAQGKKLNLVRIVAVTGDCEVDDSTQQDQVSCDREPSERTTLSSPSSTGKLTFLEPSFRHPIVTQRETDFFNNAETISSAKKQNFRLPAANRYDYGFAQGQSTRTGYPSKKTGHHKTGLLEKEHLYETARHASQQLKDAFKALQSKVEPYIAPDQELPEVDPEASLRLGSLGIELALQEKETIRLERELIASERECVMLVLNFFITSCG
ncbi:hypothetical protein E4U11_008185 [Claviceps purpurea]|nr:hypothetical protein E4U11_008185 [Claviceps purpurea]